LNQLACQKDFFDKLSASEEALWVHRYKLEII
jgi:hypothetical protein